MITELKDYVDAAKLDILEYLSRKEELGVFEFRRVGEIAALMIPLINSRGTHHEHGAIAEAMRDAEILAPNLFEMLANRAFDVNAMLRVKYNEMLRQHTELKKAQLDIQEAAQHISLQRAELEGHKKILIAHEEHIERERERLQLEARIHGKEVHLPELPRLIDPDKDTEEQA